VHEWWVPGTEPGVGVKACVTPRNPLTYLEQGGKGLNPGVECDELLAQCGEAFAQCGNTLSVEGYPLVNKVVKTVPDYTILCGEAAAECGEAAAECGQYEVLLEVEQEYIIPNDPAKWHYFVYIGAQTFPALASVESSRRDEFEELLLKYCPAHMWIGVLVTYN